MQGIEQLTNIMTEGGRSDVPMSMGAQPMGAPQGIAGMMSPQDMAMMQQEQVPNPADSAPQGIDINNDADMLASAVVGRTNGDLDEAEQVLEQSLMLIKSAKMQSQEPTMAAYGKPIMAAEGKPIPDGKEGAGLRALPKEVVEKMGFVKAAEGKEIPKPTDEQLRGMSQADFDRLFNLSQRAVSDMDKNMSPSQKLREEMRQLIMSAMAAKPPTGGRAISELDEITVTAKPRVKPMRPSNKPGMAYGGDVKKMMGGGQMMKYADGGEMEEYNMGGQIIPFV
tara:strand:- start:537 stop:1379 length:843 start_codon:yes stop_codon:yes gene_type:complete